MTQKVVIEGVERTFPNLGSRAILDATGELRAIRQRAFQQTAGALAQTWDAESAAQNVKAAIQQYMNSMLIDDGEIKAWFVFTAEGQMFLVSKSLVKSGLSLKDANIVVDSMSREQITTIGMELAFGVFPDLRPETYEDPEPAVDPMPPAE